MSEKHPRKNARAMLNKSGYGNLGGHFGKHSDEAEDKALIKKMVKKPALKLKTGGVAEGDAEKPRADRLRRGGKAHGKKGHGKPHTQVNVIVAGQHPKPVPVPVPKPVPVPVDPNAMAGAPPPGVGPGGPGPMPPDAGAPPMGLKTGGRAKAVGSDSQREPIKGLADGQFKKGGRTREKFPVPMDSGAGGGKGRMEKIKDYG